ncbi:MAG: hypothetical protein Q9174_001383 [Haloplaca sp. 1 TL-2023]
MVSTRNSIAGLGSASTNDTSLQHLTEPSAASSVDASNANEPSSQAPNRSRKRRRSASPEHASTELKQKRATIRKPSTSSTNNAGPATRNGSAYPGPTFPASAHASGRLINQVSSGLNSYAQGNGSIVTGSHGHPQQLDGPGDLFPSENDDDTVAPQPDMHAVISQIIDHGEHVGSQYGVSTEGSAAAFTTSQLKFQSLPVLENVAAQILTIFANTSFHDLLMLTSDRGNSDASEAYSSLKFLFDATKKVYSITDPFLFPRELGFTQRAHIDTICKANLATFMSSVFGSQDVSFYHLDEFFLDTFVPHGTRLLKTQAGLFLDLKTQAYISALMNNDQSREENLEDLFPQDLEQRLLKRRPGASQPSPAEADFVQRANNRKKALLEESQTVEAKAQLADKYIWEDFLRDILSYTSKNSAYAKKTKGTTRKPDQSRSTNFFEMEQQQASQQEVRALSEDKSTKAAEAIPPVTNLKNARVAQMVPPDTDDIAEKAVRAAEFAMQDFSVHQQPASSLQQISQDQSQQYSRQYPFHYEQQPVPYYSQSQYTNAQSLPPQPGHEQQPQQHQPQQQNLDLNQQQTPYQDQGHVPFPSQSAPTSILYERARLAATAKASPSNRRAGHPSQRRPWTPEEENALMFGLDQVKGPHWSQILAMYGPGGTINETLKDRNQVQLKDKARNLKLFFLKSGIEVPYCLQLVTGELKTRAPQAARLAAKEAAEAAAAAAPNPIPNVDGNDDGDAVQGLDGAEEAGGVEEAVGGAEDREAVGDADDQEDMEDGEGEMIDPAEYAAAVHAAGSRNVGTVQGNVGMQSSDAQQQLYEAAGSG